MKHVNQIEDTMGEIVGVGGSGSDEAGGETGWGAQPQQHRGGWIREVSEGAAAVWEGAGR